MDWMVSGARISALWKLICSEYWVSILENCQESCCDRNLSLCHRIHEAIYLLYSHWNSFENISPSSTPMVTSAWWEMSQIFKYYHLGSNFPDCLYWSSGRNTCSRGRGCHQRHETWNRPWPLSQSSKYKTVGKTVTEYGVSKKGVRGI